MPKYIIGEKEIAIEAKKLDKKLLIANHKAALSGIIRWERKLEGKEAGYCEFCVIVRVGCNHCILKNLNKNHSASTSTCGPYYDQYYDQYCEASSPSTPIPGAKPMVKYMKRLAKVLGEEIEARAKSDARS